MKHIIVIILASTFGLFYPTWLYAQKNAKKEPISNIFSKYEEKTGVESITISPALLGLMQNSKSSDKKTQDLISKISGLQILSLSEMADKKLREELMFDLQSAIEGHYEQILKVKNANERIELYQTKDKNKYGALLFITSSDNDLTVIHLTGSIDKDIINALINGEIGPI